MRNIYLILILICSFGTRIYANPCYFDIRTHDLDTELLLEDYAGKRIGYDFINNKKVMELEHDTASYANEYSDNEQISYNLIDCRPPKSGLYKLKIYANKDSQFEIYIRASNEIVDTFDKSIEGVITKGEVQNIEILYSINKNIAATKIVDIGLIEKELNYIKNQALFDKKSIAVWTNYAENAKKELNNKAEDKARVVLNSLITILNNETKRNEPQLQDGFMIDIDKIVKESENSVNNDKLLGMIINRALMENFKPKPIDFIIASIGVYPFEINDNNVYMREFKNEHTKNKYKLLNEVLDKNGIDLDDTNSLITVERIANYFNELVSIPNLTQLLDNNMGLKNARTDKVNIRTMFINRQKITEIYPLTLKGSNFAITNEATLYSNAKDKVDAIKKDLINCDYIISISTTLVMVRRAVENQNESPENKLKDVVDILDKDIRDNKYADIPSGPIGVIVDSLFYKSGSSLEKIYSIKTLIDENKNQLKTESKKAIGVIITDIEQLMESIHK